MTERNTLFDRQNVRHTSGPSDWMPFWVTGDVASAKSIITGPVVHMSHAVKGRDGLDRELSVDRESGYVHINGVEDDTVVVLAKVATEGRTDDALADEAWKALGLDDTSEITVTALVDSVIGQNRAARGLDSLA